MFPGVKLLLFMCHYVTGLLSALIDSCCSSHLFIILLIAPYAHQCLGVPGIRKFVLCPRNSPHWTYNKLTEIRAEVRCKVSTPSADAKKGERLWKRTFQKDIRN